jgi:RNA polymerase sigma factor (sigma-70 family)
MVFWATALITEEYPLDTCPVGSRAVLSNKEPMSDDAELLRRYADSRSEDAFTQYVERNFSLVYSAALRRTNGDVHLAQDVAQLVFTSLAKNARSVARHAVPAGWLYVTTRNAAANLMRSERRRKAREKEAMTIREPSMEGESVPNWEDLRHHLDAIMDLLNEKDRNAVLLRCLQGRPFAEIGRILRTSEDAARKRVDRALEKLRSLLARRGITSTSAALAAALSTQAGITVPIGLAARVSGQALAVAGHTAGGQVAILMNTTKVTATLAAAVGIAAGVFLYRQQHQEAQLKQEMATLRLALARQANQAADASTRTNARAELASTGGQFSNTRSQSSDNNQSDSNVGHSWPSLTGGMIQSANWSNRGTATPLAALESYLWAVDRVDVGATGETIAFGQLKAKVDAFYASLPDNIKAEYDTPEKLWAEVLTGSPHGPSFVSYGVVSQTPDPAQPGQAVVLDVIILNQNGVTSEGNMSFELAPDGWRRTLPTNLIAPVANFLNPTGPK